MDNKKEFIVDADMFLNNWYTPFYAKEDIISGLGTLENTRLYMSLSNFHYFKVMIAKTQEIMESDTKLLSSWKEDHKTLIAIANSKKYNKDVLEFAKNRNNFMQGIIINKIGLSLVLFKGYKLDMSEIEGGDDISPTIEETIAFCNYKLEQKNKSIDILTNEDLLTDFASEHNFKLPIVRIKNQFN